MSPSQLESPSPPAQPQIPWNKIAGDRLATNDQNHNTDSHTDHNNPNSNPSEPPLEQTPHQPKSTPIYPATETQQQNYRSLLQQLLSANHEFYLPESSSPPPILPDFPSQQSSDTNTNTISSLSLHPTLESLLHILNRTLPSAHFLLRHAETAPAHESMYIHGMLHRVEGDVDNARAWYGNVLGSEVFGCVWGDGNWREFLGRVERWRDRGRRRRRTRRRRDGHVDGDGDEVAIEVDWAVEETELRRMSLDELMKVLEFCERKFGVGRVEDARSEYTGHGEKKEKSARMVIGGEGWREF